MNAESFLEEVLRRYIDFIKNPYDSQSSDGSKSLRRWGSIKEASFFAKLEMNATTLLHWSYYHISSYVQCPGQTQINFSEFNALKKHGILNRFLVPLHCSAKTGFLPVLAGVQFGPSGSGIGDGDLVP